MTATDSYIIRCPYCSSFEREGSVPCGQHMPPRSVVAIYEALAEHIKAVHMDPADGTLIPSSCSKRPTCLHQSSGRAR